MQLTPRGDGIIVMFSGCRVSGEENDIKYNKRICAYYITFTI